MLKKESPNTFQCPINSLCLCIFYYSLNADFCLHAYLFQDLVFFNITIYTLHNTRSKSILFGFLKALLMWFPLTAVGRGFTQDSGTNTSSPRYPAASGSIGHWAVQ